MTQSFDYMDSKVLTIHWKAIEQYFAGVLFVFRFSPVCYFGKFINIGLGAFRSERVTLSSLSLQVVEGGGQMDINFNLVSPAGAVLVNDEKKSDEVHTVEAVEPGIYSFCFDNSFSTLAQKTVYADLGIEYAEEDDWFKSLTETDVEESELQIESFRVCILVHLCP